MHNPLVGTWELVSREGQDSPPPSRRVFGRHTFTWDDHGRPESEREKKGKYRILGCEFVTRPDGALYEFSVDGDALTVQRIKPTLGANTKYRRV